MTIRVHKDATTPEAIADNLRLLFGDVFEDRDDIPKDTSFKVLLENSDNFKDWIVDKIQINLFTDKLVGTAKEFELFREEEFKAIEVNDELLDKVFTILSDETREDFINYRLELIKESQKEKPNIVEVG